MADNKEKRVSMMYLENHRQVNLVVTTDQVVNKEFIVNQKFGLRCLLGRTWSIRVMLTTVQRTWNLGQELLKRNWLLPMPSNQKPQSVSKKDISSKRCLRSCIQYLFILGHPGKNYMPWNNYIGYTCSHDCIHYSKINPPRLVSF